MLADIAASAFVVEDLVRDDYRRCVELMERYADSDIGFESRSWRPWTIVTFRLLRPRHVDALQLLPA